jgi:hypothetical protein
VRKTESLIVHGRFSIEEIKIGNLVVIPQGAIAIGTVTEARPKKSFGRAGKLNVNIDYVRLINGDKVSLRSVKGGSGGSRTGVMTGAVVATAIVFFPAAPLFFFIKGKNIGVWQSTVSGTPTWLNQCFAVYGHAFFCNAKDPQGNRIKSES